MKPYYEQDGITIYHGDCRELLEAGAPLAATCFVTDPPYGMAEALDKDHGDLHKSGKAAYAPHHQWRDTTEYVEKDCAAIISSLASQLEAGALTCAPTNIWLYPPADDVGCFWRPAATTHGPWGFTVFTPILFYGKNPRRGKGDLPAGFSYTRRAELSEHPCPKPGDPWRWLVAKVTNPGATKDAVVLDPFLGSGTTLVVAKDLGLRAIGIEIEERYCEIAARRLDQTVLAL